MTCTKIIIIIISFLKHGADKVDFENMILTVEIRLFELIINNVTNLWNIILTVLLESNIKQNNTWWV